MKVHLIYTQREDASFDHSVAFGDTPPWRALEENVVNCASETDAVRLKKKIEDMQAMLSMNIECSIYERDVEPTIERAFVVEATALPSAPSTEGAAG